MTKIYIFHMASCNDIFFPLLFIKHCNPQNPPIALKGNLLNSKPHVKGETNTFPSHKYVKIGKFIRDKFHLKASLTTFSFAFES